MVAIALLIMCSIFFRVLQQSLLLYCTIKFCMKIIVLLLYSLSFLLFALISDSSSLSSTASSHSGMDSYLCPPFPAKPSTSSPALHALSLNDLNFVQGHQRSGSSGDKNKIQISAELKKELASRITERRGVFGLWYKNNSLVEIL